MIAGYLPDLTVLKVKVNDIKSNSTGNQNTNGVSDEKPNATTSKKKRMKLRHMCHICNREFTKKCGLTNHLLIHAGVKPYICEICYKTFTKKCTLTVHLLTHSLERPHVCDTCEKSFARKTDLQKHKFVHTGEKRYICEVCDKRFTHQNNLRRHNLKHFPKESKKVEKKKDIKSILLLDKNNQVLNSISKILKDTINMKSVQDLLCIGPNDEKQLGAEELRVCSKNIQETEPDNDSVPIQSSQSDVNGEQLNEKSLSNVIVKDSTLNNANSDKDQNAIATEMKSNFIDSKKSEIMKHVIKMKDIYNALPIEKNKLEFINNFGNIEDFSKESNRINFLSNQPDNKEADSIVKIELKDSLPESCAINEENLVKIFKSQDTSSVDNDLEQVLAIAADVMKETMNLQFTLPTESINGGELSVFDGVSKDLQALNNTPDIVKKTTNNVHLSIPNNSDLSTNGFDVLKDVSGDIQDLEIKLKVSKDVPCPLPLLSGDHAIVSESNILVDINKNRETCVVESHTRKEIEGLSISVEECDLNPFDIVKNTHILDVASDVIKLTSDAFQLPLPEDHFVANEFDVLDDIVKNDHNLAVAADIIEEAVGDIQMPEDISKTFQDLNVSHHMNNEKSGDMELFADDNACTNAFHVLEDQNKNSINVMLEADLALSSSNEVMNMVAESELKLLDHSENSNEDFRTSLEVIDTGNEDHKEGNEFLILDVLVKNVQETGVASHVITKAADELVQAIAFNIKKDGLKTYESTSSAISYSQIEDQCRAKESQGHVKPSSDVQEVFCDICGEVFHNEHDLLMHISNHVNDDSNKCYLCDLTFENAELLQAHLIGHGIDLNKMDLEEDLVSSLTSGEISLDDIDKIGMDEDFDEKIARMYALAHVESINDNNSDTVEDTEEYDEEATKLYALSQYDISSQNSNESKKQFQNFSLTGMLNNTIHKNIPSIAKPKEIYKKPVSFDVKDKLTLRKNTEIPSQTNVKCVNRDIEEKNELNLPTNSRIIFKNIPEFSLKNTVPTEESKIGITKNMDLNKNLEKLKTSDINDNFVFFSPFSEAGISEENSDKALINKDVIKKIEAFLQDNIFETVDNESSSFQPSHNNENTININTDHSSKKESISTTSKVEPLADQKKYSCHFCDKVFVREFYLQTHLLIHAGKTFKCEVCAKSFSKKYSLNVHSLVHSGERKHACIECGKSFTRKADLQKHSMVHTGQKPFSCDVCQKSFNYQCNLRRHKLLHSNQKPFVCYICKTNFSDRISLLSHMKIHIQQVEIKALNNENINDCLKSLKEKFYECNICKKLFARRDRLFKHKLTHAVKKILLCEFCGCTFQKKDQLEAHLSVHSHSKFKGIDVSSGALSEVDMPTMDNLQKTFTCELCFKVYNRSSALKCHYLTHTGEKPHKCPICQKGFAQRTNLKRHILSHSGAKPFMCDICKKSFTRKPGLRNHYLTHTSDELFNLFTNLNDI